MARISYVKLVNLVVLFSKVRIVMLLRYFKKGGGQEFMSSFFSE